MRLLFPGLGGFLLVPLLCMTSFQQQKTQQDQKETPVSTGPTSSVERKNPVKPTPESLASAKKFFGFDCAMCHGANGDGKGDLASSMSLKMNDWHEVATLAKISDGELFDIILKGKGKMEGEGDRLSTEKIWELVNYVRSLQKNVAAPKG